MSINDAIPQLYMVLTESNNPQQQQWQIKAERMVNDSAGKRAIGQ
jgi:hypothetical protein